MRVTTFGANAQYLSNLDAIMQKYQTLEAELSTGRQLNQPSDNPVAMSQDIQVQSALSLVTQWNNNAGSALSSMQTADGTLSQLQSALGTIRTQLVQAMNGTNTPSDLQNIGATVFQEVNNVAQLANTNDGSTYIFAGTNGLSVPLSVTSSAATHTISAYSWSGSGNTNTEVGHGVSVQTNVDGKAVFNTVPSGGASDLMTTLENISNTMNHPPATAAALNAALGSSLSDLDANLNNISAIRADLGGRMNRMQAAQTQTQTMTLNLQTQQGQAQDANVAQVVSQITTQQTVYQAALSAGKNLILPTLADILQ